MIRATILAAVLLLAACGADGEPEPFESSTGISGEVKIGVVGSL